MGITVLLGVWAAAASLVALALWLYAASVKASAEAEAAILDTALEGLKYVRETNQRAQDSLEAVRDSLETMAEGYEATLAAAVAEAAYRWLLQSHRRQRQLAGAETQLERWVAETGPQTLGQRFAAFYMTLRRRQRQGGRQHG